MPSYTQYKRQMAVLDDDNDIESWITVKGNHIPIKKGQSKEDAVKSFLESKGNGGKTGTPKGEKINAGNVKSDDIVSFGNEKEKYKVRGFTGKGNGSEKLALKELNSGKESHRSIGSGTEIYKHEPEDTKIEFQEAFKGTKWNAGNGFATYVDEDYRFEIYKEGGMYVSTVSPSDDYDGSDVEEEEMFSTLQEARNHAEQMVKEYAGLSDEQKADKVKDVRRIVGGSVQYEKTGKVFRLTGYYSGGSVDLDFEKLTGHSPESSVRYEMHGSKLYISDYNGRWEKEIDFDKLSDEEIADMIKR